MKLIKYSLRNFRRLENIEVEIEEKETIFVGPNNCGKTSATSAFRFFLADKNIFSIFDFSASHTETINSYGHSGVLERTTFPEIQMDLWFSVDPNTEYGRISNLITITSIAQSEIGIRISLSVKDREKLRSDYLELFPISEDGTPNSKTLFHFLTLSGNFKKHFELRYASLENVSDEVNGTSLTREEGKKAVSSLLRVDFVDAQRNIDDKEVSRGNLLSTAFATFYKKNLEKHEASEAANKVVDENNDKLTTHYETHFGGLLGIIQSLGVPSANDRQLKILSTLSPESALVGNTELHYIDAESSHELPEAYNGLGFKNLIYMAIQVSHFHLQWMQTEDNRPLCQLILIEEPEVHLHAQVQQTFISNIWKIAQKEAKDFGEESLLPQMVVTTHSSHIVDKVEFENIRYFRRCISGILAPTADGIKKASIVLSLRNFQIQEDSSDDEDKKNLAFLKRYLKLTHCDLFFSDGAILVEGTVEKLLMPELINKSAPELQSVYLTTLEVGGAYAHRFANLLKFIQIPYLVITDLDSVNPANSNKTCKADTVGAVTSNSSIKGFLDESAIEKLVGMSNNDQECTDKGCFVAFQKPTKMSSYAGIPEICARTFEETFIYENIEAVRDGSLELFVNLQEKPDYDLDYEEVFNKVKNKSFKKVEFALNLIETDFDWNVPDYIVGGLEWLKGKVL